MIIIIRKIIFSNNKKIENNTKFIILIFFNAFLNWIYSLKVFEEEKIDLDFNDLNKIILNKKIYYKENKEESDEDKKQRKMEMQIKNRKIINKIVIFI